MTPWKTLARRTALVVPRFLTVEMHEVQLPDGQVIADWAWLITPEYVNVLAETEDGLFPCFRQTKYAVGGASLAAVGGFIEPNEAPVAAARRELLEETGYEAAEWTPLGTYVVDANRGAGRAHFFLARRARPVSAPTTDDLEEQELLLLTRGELERALATGEFKVLAWASVVSLGLRHLEQLGRPLETRKPGADFKAP